MKSVLPARLAKVFSKSILYMYLLLEMEKKTIATEAIIVKRKKLFFYVENYFLISTFFLAEIPGNDRHAYHYPDVRLPSDDEYGTDAYEDEDSPPDSTKSNRVPDRANKWYSNDGKIVVTNTNTGPAVTISLTTTLLHLLQFLL